MKWKRKLHEENNTVLIECYSYERSKGELLARGILAPGGYDKVKSMLGTNGSFARIIGSSAQRLGSAAEQQSRQMSLGATGLYGRYGSYFGNYGFSGSRFDGWF